MVDSSFNVGSRFFRENDTKACDNAGKLATVFKPNPPQLSKILDLMSRRGP